MLGFQCESHESSLFFRFAPICPCWFLPRIRRIDSGSILVFLLVRVLQLRAMQRRCQKPYQLMSISKSNCVPGCPAISKIRTLPQYLYSWGININELLLMHDHHKTFFHCNCCTVFKMAYVCPHGIYGASTDEKRSRTSWCIVRFLISVTSSY